MSYESLGGFEPADIKAVEAAFQDIDHEQAVMPPELAGIPMNSMPMDLYRDLEEEISHPEFYGHEPGDQAAISQAAKRLILLEDLHRNHRELMIDEAKTPHYALVTSAALMQLRIEGNEEPYKSWNKDELLSFLDVLVEAYYDVYYPGQKLPRYY